jgi:hypothetical protein
MRSKRFSSCSDDNLFDSNKAELNITSDFLIAIEKIQNAANLLKNSTSFLSDFGPVSDELPLVKKSINELIAGECSCFCCRQEDGHLH